MYSLFVDEKCLLFIWTAHTRWLTKRFYWLHQHHPHTLTDAFRWQFLFVFLSLFSMRHTVNIERKCTIVWLLLLWTLARRPMLAVSLLLLVDGQKNRVFRENFNTNRSEFCLCTSAFKMLFTLNSFDFLLVNVTVFLRGSNTYYHCSFSMQSIRWKLLTNTKEKHGNNMQTYARIRIQSPLNVCSIYWFFHVSLFFSLFLSFFQKANTQPSRT